MNPRKVEHGGKECKILINIRFSLNLFSRGGVLASNPPLETIDFTDPRGGGQSLPQ